MAGRSAAGVLAVPTRVGELVSAAAARQHQANDGRREEAAAGAGGRTTTAPKRRSYEAGRDGAATKRHRAATAGLSGRKRKRDADEVGDDGSAPVGEGPRLPVTPPALPLLQQLLDVCRAALNGSSAPPPAPTVEFIRGLMDRIGPDDISFFHSMSTATLQDPPRIRGEMIHHCDNFTVAVFFLPPGSVMPMHDHQGMTVFSKLLTGSVHVEGYDWVRPHVRASVGARRLAEKVVDRTVVAGPLSGAWVLFPESGGNIHRFTASWEDGPCAFLDVLTPSYAPPHRPCTYFQDLLYHVHHPDVVGGTLEEEQKHRLTWLQEITEQEAFQRAVRNPPAPLAPQPAAGQPPSHL